MGEQKRMHDDFNRLLEIADTFFDGNVFFFRSAEVWKVVLGQPPLTTGGQQELLEAASGETLMDAVRVALQRAAPLSEER